MMLTDMRNFIKSFENDIRCQYETDKSYVLEFDLVIHTNHFEVDLGHISTNIITVSLHSYMYSKLIMSSYILIL